MLDGLDLGVVAGQAGAQGGLGDQVGAAGDLDHGIQVDAAEQDAGVGRRRSQRQEDLVPAVQPHAGGTDDVLQGALAEHGAIVFGYGKRRKVSTGRAETRMKQ